MNPSQRRAHFSRLLEPRFFIFILIYLLCKAKQTHSLILTGSKDAYARYPKWAQTFENQLSFEFKTRSENALLLYTDDGGVQGNFYCLTIVDGHIQLDFRLGDEQDTMLSRPVHTLRLGAIRVADGNWHRFILFQAWENIKLQVDDAVEFKILTQRSFVFGNLRTNSDVFIGGIPKDIHLLSTMSSPLRRHTKKYAGSLKNLVYRLYPQGVSSPQLIDSFGTRLTDDDYCMESANPVQFCKNSGSCYSTNDGPKCECPSDFEGRQCEKPKPSSELSFYGNEWIGYDVSNSSSASVLSRSENVSLQFKTKNQNGLLFVAGDRQNFVQLVLERGVLIAASKLFGSDKRIIRQRFSQGLKPVRYDDGKWHTVFLHRNLHMTGTKYTSLIMRLTVDGNTDEVKQFASQTEWLGNSFAYVGGAAIGKAYVPPYNYMFKGCMKQIKYEADVQSLDIIDLADQGFGKSVIRTGGDLAFSCQESANALPDVLSFSSTGQSFITLPKWNSLSSGSLGFQFRTTASDGLILYHGVKDVPLNGSSDYIAFELSDGHLFMVLDLGSGYIRLQTTSKRVNEGSVWHSVSLERVGRQGSVIVDTIKTDFSTPGVSANLIIEEPIYLGAFPWPPTSNSAWNYSSILPLPSTIWSGHLRQGYVGCLKNLRINGINTQIGAAFLSTPSRNTTGQQTPVDGISLGCTSTSSHSSASAEAIDYCADSPCKNFGRCVNSFKAFECDCSLTVFDGPTCEKALPPISLALLQDQQPLFRLETPTSSQAEMLEIKFRTTDEDLVLLDTRAEGGPDRWLLFLHNGELMLALHFGSGAKHTFSWSGKQLNDNHWHTARVKRRGVKLLLFLDGKWEHSHFLPESDMSLVIHDVAPGQALRQVIDVNVNPPLELFTEKQKPSGDILKLTFNQYDILDKIRTDNADIAPPMSYTTISPNKGRLKQNSISFETEKGFAQFNANFRTNADFKLSIKFKTIAHNGLLLALVNNETTKIGEHNILLSVEMIRGRLRYRFGQTTVLLPAGDKKMNDMKWHTISIEEDSTEMTSHRILLDNEEIKIKSTPYDFSGFNGWVLVGGFPENFMPAKPHGLATVSGFKGCFSLLKIAEQQLSLLSDNVSSKDLSKGCQGPDVRCAPGLCQNNGQCHQGWRGVRCDCSQTAHSGRYCEKPATSYEFDGKETTIYYEYVGPQPNTINDELVLAFRTQSSNGVLFGVQCSVDGDYLTVFVGGGYVQVRYNLGSKDHHVGYFDTLVNDGREHLLKLNRVRSNLTLVLDELPAVNYQSNGKSELFTLNSQKYLTVGAAFNLLHSAQVVTLRRKRSDLITYDEFTGEIFGVTFNGIQVLEMFAQGHPNAHALGHPRLIKMAAKTPAFDPADFPQDSIRSSGIGHQPKHDEEDGFFELSELGCLNSAEQGDCEADVPTEGFFTPIVPKAFKQKNTPTDDTTPKPTPTKSLNQTAAVRVPTKQRLADSAQQRRTVKPTGKMEDRPESRGSYNDDDYSEDEDAAREEEEGYDEEVEDVDELNRLKTPATYAPYARAQLVNSGPNEMDSLWTDLSHAVDFKSGGSWRRPVTATSTTPMPTTSATPMTTTFSTTTKRIATTVFVSTTRWLETTTQASRQKLRTIQTDTTTTVPLFAVRPTTPMGELITTTTKAPIVTTDFPRTALISIASVSVIIIIAFVVFCVFRCRQSAPPSETTYPMAYNGVKQPSIGMGNVMLGSGNHGYTPIPSEMSPPAHHAQQFAGMSPRVNYETMNGAATLPSALRRPNGLTNGGPQPNGLGYQTIGQNQHIVNQNGQTSPARTNGNANGGMNGGSRTWGREKKKDFKEWYV